MWGTLGIFPEGETFTIVKDGKGELMKKEKGVLFRGCRSRATRCWAGGAQDAQGPGQNWVHWGQEKSDQEEQPELSRIGSWNFIPVLPLDWFRTEGPAGLQETQVREIGQEVRRVWTELWQGNRKAPWRQEGGGPNNVEAGWAQAWREVSGKLSSSFLGTE